jgi:Tfp pilus assembly protein FimT
MTLLELLIMVTVMGLVLAASVPGMRSTVEAYRLDGSVREVTSRIFISRQMAVRDKTPYVMTVDPLNDRYLAFGDTDGDGVPDPGETLLGPYQLEADMSLVNLSWTGNRMTFFPNGRASETGDIRIADGNGRTKTIRVHSTTGNAEVLP